VRLRDPLALPLRLLARRRRRRAAAPAASTLRAAPWGVLPPQRRRAPTPTVTGAAIAGGPPEVRAVGPLDRPMGRLRVVAGHRDGPDAALLADCWETASRRSARRVDAVAVALGLARAPLPAAAAADPDPVLLAASWGDGGRARAAA
jgi:hypothetical protein